MAARKAAPPVSESKKKRPFGRLGSTGVPLDDTTARQGSYQHLRWGNGPIALTATGLL
jgi:hypothetical protein